MVNLFCKTEKPFCTANATTNNKQQTTRSSLISAYSSSKSRVQSKHFLQQNPTTAMPSTSKVASAIRGNSADQTGGKQKKTYKAKTTTSSGRRDTAALSEFGDGDRCEVAVGNSSDPTMKRKERRIKKESKKSRVSKAVKRQSQSICHMAEVIKRSLSKSDQSRSGSLSLSSGKNYAIALPSGMVKDVRGR
jgi:hypothetical protein